jgi:hypothetical protein
VSRDSTPHCGAGAASFPAPGSRKSTHVATSWTTVAVSAALAVAVSPLLAGWSAALVNGDTGAW